MVCAYCDSSVVEGDRKCVNCGAPIVRDDAALQDFRSCPVCHRKLLALASPACSYCGRRLPDDYIKAREADLRRLTQIEDGERASEPDSKVGQFFSESNRRNSTSVLGLADVTSLFDILS